MYRAGIGISYIHTEGLSTNLRSYILRTSVQEKSMYVGIDIVQGNEHVSTCKNIQTQYIRQPTYIGIQ